MPLLSLLQESAEKPKRIVDTRFYLVRALADPRFDRPQAFRQFEVALAEKS